MEKLAKLVYVFLIAGIIYFAFPFFLPFLFALILAVLCEPLLLWLQHKTKFRRAPLAVCLVTAFFSAVLAFCYMAISKLVHDGLGLLKSLPQTFDSLLAQHTLVQDFYNSFSEENKLYVKESLVKLAEKATEFVSSYAGNLVHMLQAFPWYFVSLIIFMVATYIMVIELPVLRAAFLRYFELGQTQQKVEIVLDKLKTAIVGFLQAQLVFSTLTFLITAAGLRILGVDYILVASLLVVAVDLLPILGTGAVLVPWSAYEFLTGDMYTGTGLFVLFLVITAFRRIIEPKLLGDSLGLSPLATLISLYVGLEALGLLGAVIGPAALIIVKALEEAGLLRFRIKL